MAWAERLPSGKYRGKYRDAHGTIRTVDGGPFTHKAKAKNAAAAQEGKARRNIWADPDAARRTWGAWVTEWWPMRTVEPGTRKRDESRRDVHLIPRWGNVALGGIRRNDVKAWAMVKIGEGYAPATVERMVALLSASLAAAVDHEILAANPAARIRLPKPPPAQERYLTGSEVEAIARQFPTAFDRLVVETLAYTGLRFGELAGMHRDRVAWDHSALYVVETWDERDGKIKAYPKGRRVRSVPIPGWLLEGLETLPIVGDTCGVEHRSGRCRGPLLFTSPEGHVLRLSNWADRWRTAVEAANIGDARVHDLRHSYASWLLQGGRDLAEVGMLLGHVSPLTTQRYARLKTIPPQGVLEALSAPRLLHAAGGEESTVVHMPRSNLVGPQGIEP